MTTGAALLQGIDGSNHVCYIMEGVTPTDNKRMLFSANPAPASLAPNDPNKPRILQDLLRKQLGGMAAPINAAKEDPGPEQGTAIGGVRKSQGPDRGDRRAAA